jgi:hypothetical protein
MLPPPKVEPEQQEPNQPKYTGIVGAVAGLLLIVFIGSQFPDVLGAYRIDFSAITKPNFSQSSLTPDVTISADSLVAEYDRNQVAADMKYKGKTLRVTGKIINIASFGDSPQLSLGRDEYDLKNVTASFHSSARADIAPLVRGQVVTIQGTCDGVPVIGVSIGNAKLVQ